jgi:hypothetical protein
MGAAAASRARKNFDVSNMVRAYEEVYENLLAQWSMFRGPAIPAEEGLGTHQR